MPRSLAAACLGAACLAVSGLALAATPALAGVLLARIARTPPVSTPFIEVSYRGVLERPLIVSGTLRWLGGSRMERDIDSPFRETASVGDDELSVRRGNGEVRHVPLERAPQVAALLAGFRALIGGDEATLERDFTLSTEGNVTHWVLTLVPRADRVRSQLASIVIDGRNDDPRCFTVHDANGDSSITLLGATAQAGLRSVAPLESALAARCRNER